MFSYHFIKKTKTKMLINWQNRIISLRIKTKIEIHNNYSKFESFNIYIYKTLENYTIKESTKSKNIIQ